MANIAQPQVVINYISQLKKITVNRNNQPSQLIIQTDYNLNETYNFQVINKINQIVELDVNTTYQLYGTFIDAKKQVHILFYTLGVTPRDNILSFLVNTYTSEYLAYVKNNRTPIDISIVAKQNVGGSTKSYMVLRDRALANPRGYIEGQAPTDIVYQTVFNSQIPVSTAFGAGNDINLAQDLEGQEIYSFAFGDTLSTSNANQFVIGYNNEPDATKAFIVANSGNIFTVDYEGNVEAGDLNVGAISATSITVSGEDLNSLVDDKVEYLSTSIDDKLSATEDWVSDTFETKESATQTFNELEGDIGQISAFVSGLPTDIAAKADQTDVDAISSFVSGLPQDINDISNAMNQKADKEKLNELSGTVEGLADSKADLSALQEVDGKFANYTPTETITATYATKTSLEDYAKLSAIPTSTSSLTNDSGYITAADIPTYTGVAPIVVNADTHEISLDGDVGETYTAGFGLALDEQTNEFSLTGTVLSGGNNIKIENNIISLTGDIGGTYEGGQGIGIEGNVISLTATLSSITNDAGFITESALDDYALKSAIPLSTSQLTNDVPYLSAITSADIPTSYVQVDELTGQILTAYVDKEHIGDYGYQTEQNVIDTISASSGAIFDAATGAIPTDLSAFSNEHTQYVKRSEIPEGAIYYAGNGLELVANDPEDEHSPSTTFVLTAGVADLDGYNTLALKSELNDLATKDALDELSSATSGLPSRVQTLETAAGTYALADNVYSKEIADQTFATKGEIPTVSGLSAGMYSAISGDVEDQITGKNYITSDALSSLASDEDLQYVSGVVSAQAEDITALKAVSGYETVFNMLSSGNTDTLTITKDDEGEKIVFTAASGSSGGDKEYHGTADGGIEVNNVNNTITISANFLSANALEGYAEQSWVEQNFLTGTTTIPTKTSDLENDSGYITTVTSADIPTSYVQRTELSAYAKTSAALSAISVNGNSTSAIVFYDEYLKVMDLYPSQQVKSLQVNWKGMHVTGADSDFTQQDLIDGLWFSDDFKVSDRSPGYGSNNASISLKNPIPTSATISGIASAVTTGYLADYTKTTDLNIPTDSDISGIAEDVVESLSTTIRSGLASSTDIPTTVEELTDSSDYAKKTDLEGLVSTAQIADMATTGYVTGYCSAYITASDLPAQLSGGTNIQIVDNKINFVNPGYITVADLADYAKLSAIPTKVSDLTQDIPYLSAITAADIPAQYVTETELGTALADYAQTSAIPLSTSQLTNDSGYITINDVPPGTLYEAGEGLALSGEGNNIFYITAAIPTSATISSIVSAVTDNYVAASGVYTGTGLELGSQNQLNVVLSAANDSNMIVDVDQDGVIWLSSIAQGGGGGTTYTAGTGIDITSDVISVDQKEISASQIFNDVPFVSAEDITNKQRVHSVNGPTITYDPSFEVFKTTYVGGAVTLNLVTALTSQIGNGEVATFEEWITFSSAVTSISEGNVNLIGEWPDTIDNAKTHVLVRRLYNNDGTIEQYVSYAYNF